jgi:sarcosine oxidase subunit alpha
VSRAHLPAPPTGCLTDPERLVSFTFEGRTIPARAGQSIAAALFAAGVRVFTRSFKYHRPRGLFCVAGDCPNCLMNVDGRPNVRTCTEPVRQGQVVSSQNAWPSLGFDVLRAFDRLDRFLPVGFYYKRFHKPRWLWPVFEHVVRQIAGLGKVDVSAAPVDEGEIEHLHTEVCVVGGGPAGLAAAGAAAGAGAEVILLERLPRLGGRLLWNSKPGDTGPVHADSLIQPLQQARVRLFCSTSAFGLYEGSLLAAFRANTFLKIRARQIIVCTGAREHPVLFGNNDLPGIFLGQGVQRLALLYGVRAGRRAVVLTDHDGGHDLAADLEELGIPVAAVVDRRPAETVRPARAKGGWAVWADSTILRARGNKHLKAVQVARVRPDGSAEEARGKEIVCDLLCLACRPQPANELLHQGGMRFQFVEGRWVPEGNAPGLWAAGGAAGTFDMQEQVAEGRRCGAAATAVLGYPTTGQDLVSAIAPGNLATAPAAPPAGHQPSQGAQRKCFVCLCEDVTVKDLEQAVAEGFDGIEMLKRYSTVNMGPCQGKMCGQTATAICAQLTGREVGATGTTTSRPPVVPVELGVLAAGRQQPVRRTPLHHWHEAAGVTWMDAGQWKRPESYGNPAAEVRAVRSAAGLIDVSTLGKIELTGPDAAELLERVYLNRWSDLRVGRIRYAAMCTEEGILFDDGVGTRLAGDRFYLTATTGNAEAVFQWLELWRDVWGLDVAVLPQTSAYAAVNLAGPRARDVLARLTALDVSGGAFPYLAVREGEVAGVPCRFLRIGFVGETGYEIHCPSAEAWHLWESLLAAGADFGLRPFGVEAQRVLRLEKGHLIIGQDTDALSNPLDAGLGGMIRFDKPLFHGREPLLRLRARGSRSRLVGYFIEDGGLVPPEGCQVVERGVPVGRVTSARHSPTLGRSLGLAWVPAARSVVGQRFQVRVNGADVGAVVAPLPFYDPRGEHLRG